MSINRSKASQKDSGQSLVEFALILPVLMYILLGAVDLGRVFYYQVTITGAAREGVRAASVITNTDADVRNAARNEVSSTIALPDSSIAINPSPVRYSGQPVTVTVSYGFVALTPFIDAMVGNKPIPLVGSAATVVQ